MVTNNGDIWGQLGTFGEVLAISYLFWRNNDPRLKKSLRDILPSVPGTSTVHTYKMAGFGFDVPLVEIV
jgi:hypothetical protein